MAKSRLVRSTTSTEVIHRGVGRRSACVSFFFLSRYESRNSFLRRNDPHLDVRSVRHGEQT